MYGMAEDGVDGVPCGYIYLRQSLRRHGWHEKQTPADCELIIFNIYAAPLYRPAIQFDEVPRSLFWLPGARELHAHWHDMFRHAER